MKLNRIVKKLALPFVAGFGSFGAFLLAMVALSEGVINTLGVEAAQRLIDPSLIAYTFAQTAPQTIAEMTTEVTGFATTLIPAWLIYVVFALVAALGIWLIGRAVRAMKSA